MATIKSVEESEAFREARCLVKTVYDLTKESPFSKDFGLVDQIRRSAVSVLSNISEGFERDGSSEFIQFLSIAKGSVGEVKAQLVVALDQGYITADQNRKTRNQKQTNEYNDISIGPRIES